MPDNQQILNEIQELTQSCYRLELNIEVLSKNQELLRGMIEQQNRKLFSIRQTMTTVLKYWHPLILLALYSCIDPAFAQHIYQFVKPHDAA